MLKNNVKIYVPSTTNINLFGRSFSVYKNNNKKVKELQVEFSRMFGGCTTYQANGSFIMDNGKLVNEKIMIIQSFINELNDTQIEQLKLICERLRIEFNQQTISLEINNELMFV